MRGPPHSLEHVTTSHTVSNKDTVIIFSNLNEEQKSPQIIEIRFYVDKTYLIVEKKYQKTTKK